jgi:hypothetical protein
MQDKKVIYIQEWLLVKSQKAVNAEVCGFLFLPSVLRKFGKIVI